MLLEGASVKPSDGDSIRGLYNQRDSRALILSLLPLLSCYSRTLVRLKVSPYRATVPRYVPCHCKPGREYFA